MKLVVCLDDIWLKYPLERQKVCFITAEVIQCIFNNTSIAWSHEGLFHKGHTSNTTTMFNIYDAWHSHWTQIIIIIFMKQGKQMRDEYVSHCGKAVKHCFIQTLDQWSQAWAIVHSIENHMPPLHVCTFFFLTFIFFIPSRSWYGLLHRDVSIHVL